MNRGSDREAVVERLLRQSLTRAGEAMPRGQCLDAEMLAAWVDGALKGEELKIADVHLSDCSRCLSMVAQMVKTTPEPEPATRWWGIGVLRWWVPLTAGIAAIAIWIAVPGDRSRPPEQTIARTEVTPAEPAAQQPAQELRSETLADKSSPVEPAERFRGNRQAERTDADANADAKASGAREVAKEAEPSRPSALSEFQAVSRDERTTPPPPPPAPPPPVADSARTAVVGALEERVTTGASPASPGAAAAPASTAARSTQARRANTETGAAVVEIASPDAAVRWRVGARGFVQLSRDSGANWEALGSGVTADLVAGASPSATVCWVVGRAGTVLLTTDGRNWQRLTFPEPIDLTAVRATDARKATVTTADGRMFTTTNAGLTWAR